MCRLLAYLGSEILLEDVVVKPVNSIVRQSLHARESTVPTNGDGFGLGWYAPQINPDPALFVSIFPAWNDSNLLHLTAKIKSPCFFAHVRAASVGGINPYNCHPFIHNQWMLMHNGHIQDFVAVKRHLRRLLDDDIYNWIQGETDSEHLFALFLQLAKGKDLSELSVVVDVLEITFYEIALLIKKYGKPGPSFYNICLTDGQRLVASRYCSDTEIRPESLHYLAGKFFTSEEEYQREEKSDRPECVIITSEKLTDFHGQWHSVPVNHFLSVDGERQVTLRPINVFM
jgi:glutamine amidotransferase